jgi:hypothetical protein
LAGHEILRNIGFIEIIGVIGAALMVATLAMKSMIPLRILGIASSIFQISFAVSAGITDADSTWYFTPVERLSSP